MNYCKTCNELRDGDVCHFCGEQNLQPPAPDNFCFLAEKEVVWADFLMQALKDNDIQNVYRPVLPVGISANVGNFLNRYRVFVPYSKFEEANDIEKALFGELEQTLEPDESIEL